MAEIFDPPVYVPTRAASSSTFVNQHSRHPTLPTTPPPQPYAGNKGTTNTHCSITSHSASTFSTTATLTRRRHPQVEGWLSGGSSTIFFLPHKPNTMLESTCCMLPSTLHSQPDLPCFSLPCDALLVRICHQTPTQLQGIM